MVRSHEFPSVKETEVCIFNISNTRVFDGKIREYLNLIKVILTVKRLICETDPGSTNNLLIERVYELLLMAIKDLELASPGRRSSYPRR